MKKAIFWGLLTVFLIWFFYDGIPVDVFSSWSTSLLLLAGISTAISATIFLFNILPKPEPVKLENGKIPEGDNTGFLIMGLILFFVIGFPIFLIYHNVNRESEELEKYGEYTTGFIVDGSSFKTRRADFTNVTIQYKTKEGVVYTEKCDISSQEFNQHYQNEEVPLVYSKRYPSFYRIIRGDESIEKFSKKEIRELAISDFEKILEMKNPEEINTFLNTINQKWDYTNSKENDAKLYNNNFKEISLKVIGNKEIMYLHNTVDPNLFEDEIKKLGFKLISSPTNKGLLYSNDKYILNKRVENIPYTSDEMGINSFKQLSLIELVKKDKI